MSSRLIFYGIISTCIFLILKTSLAASDRIYAPRFYPNRSCVCVCNKTYCDTITREEPGQDKSSVYTSSEAGQRFVKTSYNIKLGRRRAIWSRLYTLDLYPSMTYQTVEGFGGAITDSAGLNWRSLKDPKLKQSLIDSYFSDYGLQYNMLRVPIGGTDFSTRAYAYNEDYVGDIKLGNFSLAPEDMKYKIPMIKACQKAANTDLHIVSTVWSPPSWMKDNGKLFGNSRLKKKYYQTFADYHCKFIHEYEKYGIPIWGITTTNEPINGVMNAVNFNSLGWSTQDMGKWIQNNLGPTMHKKCPGVKIIGGDDARFLLPLWLNVMTLMRPGALKYLDGVAVHWYFDDITPAELLKKTMEPYPGKFVIATEASEGSKKGETKVDLGSWTRAVNYVKDIIEDMNNDVIGWIDWNLCLNLEGGPNWINNRVDSPVIVNAEKREFYKQPMFYAMGHFSKFVPRGSKRILVREFFSDSTISKVAFLTPQNSIVVVMYNDDDNEKPVTIQLSNKSTTLIAAPKSIITIEMSR